MALRRSQGFVRYALSVQYHGSSLLGFAYQGEQHEDCILPDGKTDLRGYRSVEGRIREALSNLVGDDSYENFQVSSRTDRGVHALKNTFHVDIRKRQKEGEVMDDNNDAQDYHCWEPQTLHRGLNYYLSRQGGAAATRRRKRRRGRSSVPLYGFVGDEWRRHSPMQDVRILSAAKAPLYMANKFYNEDNDDEPPTIDWNVRFSASQRTYVYRILNMTNDERDYAVPFEFDRSWRICSETSLDVAAMNEAASFLVGNHDFTSFRGNNCQRISPVVRINDIQVKCQPYGHPLLWNASGGLLGLGKAERDSNVNIVTVAIVGKSFLYRQVRNIVGCLADAGLRKITPHDVKLILEERDRAKAPAMAPAHGLFLVDVQHDFVF